ncbi:hypothetical protein VTL71DRAFT_3605 [Oculimacula yallundae]|uniref:Uncharacterized protein n=1 Tax=Oculimacula yallundae TaxID=86028 RepID=A0ABR4C870_9HELO
MFILGDAESPSHFAFSSFSPFSCFDVFCLVGLRVVILPLLNDLRETRYPDHRSMNLNSHLTYTLYLHFSEYP